MRLLWQSVDDVAICVDFRRDDGADRQAGSGINSAVMASKDEIAAVIPRLGRGARINLKLADGGEVLGTLYGLFDGLVHFEEEGIGPIELDRIEDLLVRTHTENLPRFG